MLDNEQISLGKVDFELQAEGAFCVIVRLCAWGRSELFSSVSPDDGARNIVG